MSFSELGLSEKVLEAVAAAGYTSPTPIQAQAIPPALARRDVLGIAQTGTGKTAAFTLPMLNRLETGRARARMPRTLILEPTRELAAQVEENFARLGVNHKLSVALLIGGVSFADQDAKITRGVDVLIATPGRLLDHFERGKLLLTGIEILVIDEADRMLDMGFIPDIERICKMVPFTRQTLFFSATMPPEIQRLTEAFLSNPVKVEVARPASTASTITQRLVASGADARDKRQVLRRLIRHAEDLRNAIIFCNRKRDVATLYRSLEKHGFSVVALHGDMDQMSRMQALDKFRSGGASLLVASDVAARGLDIPEVSHVFNFDVPFHPEDYVHRIGRTGRAGRSGYAASIVTRQDVKALAAIESLIGNPVEWEGKTLDELLADEPDLDKAEPSRERGRRGDRRDRERREERPDRRTAHRDGARAEAGGRTPPARREPARHEPVRHEPVRHEPVRHEPVRAGERPAARARHDDELPMVGFGDHIPAFLLRKVVLGPPTDDTGFIDDEMPVVEEVAATDVAEPAGQAAEEHGQDSRRKRSRRKRTIDITTPESATPESAAGTTAEATADEAAPAETAAPATQPTEPIAQTAEAAPAASEATSPAPAEKPARRPRRKAAPPTPSAEAAPVQETPVTETPVEDAPATEAAPAKRPRSRRKATATGADAGPATPAAPASETAEAIPTDAAQASQAATASSETSSSETPKPKATRTRRAKADSAETGSEPSGEAADKPARKTATRRTATPKTAAPKATAAKTTAAKTATRKTTTAKTTTASETAVAETETAEAADKPVRKPRRRANAGQPSAGQAGQTGAEPDNGATEAGQAPDTTDGLSLAGIQSSDA